MDPESSLELLAKARIGDEAALERLLERYLPRLRRWASGRLPRWARDRGDTDDLVQETVIRTLSKLEGFEPRGEGALQAYLRQGLLNRIRDAVRRAGRRQMPAELDEEIPGREESPLELEIGRESVRRYDAALAKLQEQDREAIIGRIELGQTYGELAGALGKPSADAARVAVRRALLKLAEAMRDGRA